ncbi:unnamed protein product [Rhizoctonia solani]|uniref:RRN6 K-rich C-terminal domain-containing protein n=1 Tax=Rhizoctonia solani TaxID=456999 RepID=A0A8H3AI87_9AGAM|nr:unnamed protein product [Rhizoctonia solani]
MGQSFDSLGASVLFDEKWGTVFSPSEQPGWKAPAPILQITKSNTIYKPDANTYTHAGCLFAVRTLFDVNFVSITPQPGATVIAKQRVISSFGQVDIGRHRPFDLVFNPHEQSHAGLVVSDIGGIWSFGLDSKPRLLYTQADDTINRVGAYDLPYWGLQWGTHPETFMLGSRSKISLYDKRVPDVVSVSSVPETITSFDAIENENFAQIFVSDMKHVSLVDERMLSRPVVSWAHYRDRDMTLRIKALELGQKKAGLLTSKRSSLISVYDPLLSETGELKSCNSYGLEWDSPNSCISTSIAVYIPPTTARATLFHLSSLGAIYRQDLGVGPCEPSAERVVWEHELKSLAEKVELQYERHSKEDLTKCRQVNVRSKYEGIFMTNLGLDGPSVTEVVDLAPTAFQRANEPVDRPMILHDLVHMIPQETTSVIPRSLFASTRSLPLPKARLLLKHTTHLRDQSREAVSWSYDLSKTQAHIWPGLAPTPTADDLLAFSVLDNASESAAKRDKEARQEIVLDLTLSTTVYSTAPFNPSRPKLLPAPVARDNDDMLSVAASALTLEGIEPPHVQHVQPCPTLGLVDGKQGAEQRQSLVARLLASEWDPDSSPADYEFHDPYNQDYDEGMPAWKLMAQTKAEKQSLEQAKLKFMSARATMAPVGSVALPSIQISRNKPPMIPNPITVRGARQVESQPELVENQTISSQFGEPSLSQMNEGSQRVNTQITSGLFGARPGTSAVPKKKKTRLPGF